MNTTIIKAALSLTALWAFSGATLAQSLLAKAQKSGAYRSLIEDNTAGQVGDILTIVIKEEHAITQEDKTKRESSTGLAAALQAFNLKPNAFKSGILPEFNVTSKRSFEGQAKQDRNQTFVARVAVTVRDILPNGNLVIVGNRTIRVDDEDKTLQISGVIRKLDILPNNTIKSDQVADAKIAIKGKGKSTESITKGPIGKILETAWWLVWPF